MKRTIQVPLQVVGGRLQMTPTEAADQGREVALLQLIRLRLLDPSNDNPWLQGLQQLPDATFSRANGANAGQIEAQVRRIFVNLEQTRRAKLESVKVSSSAGVLTVAVVFTSLETGGRQSMEVSSAGS